MAEIRRIGLDEVARHFEELEDPRSTVNRQHPLVSVVVIALMAVIAVTGVSISPIVRMSRAFRINTCVKTLHGSDASHCRC